ncbi:DUF4174 domain-containing protein [Pseudomonas sp. 5Ae-yellow]|uniref:DUF4174 domain-containing protein n=1 Tax=Pseudomonas sp. 5Ae-yellow TaxID=2759848 RepID=UPI0015F622C3|nr:DUF4174 domain-containing protein [Pseudomonas sp. 5Ae-yellow]MBA6419149.1 DUF4174 domain-containing protein [Pseudomonas sp. 5Ae-yellow]
MKYLLTLFLCLFSVVAQSQERVMLNDITSLKWQNRIIIVSEPQAGANAAALLEQNVAEINERDVIWFVINGQTIKTNYQGYLTADLRETLMAKYTLNAGETILIGKDGGTKRRLDTLDLDTLFSAIDAMPMRQSEMRE